MSQEYEDHCGICFLPSVIQTASASWSVEQQMYPSSRPLYDAIAAAEQSFTSEWNESASVSAKKRDLFSDFAQSLH